MTTDHSLEPVLTECGPDADPVLIMSLITINDGMYAGLTRNITDWNSCEDPSALIIKPRLGDAVLFYNVLPNLAINEQALHAGCPVKKGVKWTIVRWMHEKPWVDREAA